MTIDEFLKKYDFNLPDVKNLTISIMQDMESGLSEKARYTKTSEQPMIIASSRIPQGKPKNDTAIVIDAGGTNFRSCLVQVDSNSNFNITEIHKTFMPATDRELSKDDFYDAIAQNLDYLKDKAEKIGFCFSYAMEMTKDGDGKVMYFSKEVKAPEAVGTYVGKELKKALQKRGWTKIKKITMLNDTTASLLAGVAQSGGNSNYSSYIGFILGTGINNAYIEYDKIGKADDDSDEHIIVCECGMFSQVGQSAFDREFDKKSNVPGASKLEKMCSGVYVGGVAFNEIAFACNEGLFSEGFAREFEKLSGITPYNIDMYLANADQLLNKSVACESVLAKCIKCEEDNSVLKTLLSLLLERSACIVSAVLSASVLKSGRGTAENAPVCIVANGSTFWKSFNLSQKVSEILKETLSGNWQRYFEIIKVSDDIVLGASIAAMM